MEDFVDPTARALAVPDRRLRRSAPPVVSLPLDGPSVARFPAMEREVHWNGLRFILLPPGETTLRSSVDASLIEVDLNPPLDALWSWNSDRLQKRMMPADGLAFLPRGGEYRISIVNVMPDLMLEIEPAAWPDSLQEAFAFTDTHPDLLFWEHDPVPAELGRAGMRLLMEDHRTGERADALTLEGIALGLIGRVAKRLSNDRRCARPEPAPSALPRRKLRMVTEYVEANLHETIQVADLAELAAMSVSHFARCFRLAMGVSPARYVVMRRVERAKLMLTHRDDLSIAEIAFCCGFAGQAHLTRVFKDVTGTTPGGFRNDAR